jgi:hypothetical protein
VGRSAPHFSCRTTPPLPQLSSSCAESVVASICLGSTRTGVRQPKPDTVSKKPQSCSWSQTPRSPHARAGHNPFRKLLYVTYPQALRVRKQGILGSVRMFDVPYLNLNIRPQPFFESRKNNQPSAASHLPEILILPLPALERWKRFTTSLERSAIPYRYADDCFVGPCSSCLGEVLEISAGRNSPTSLASLEFVYVRSPTVHRHGAGVTQAAGCFRISGFVTAYFRYRICP